MDLETLKTVRMMLMKIVLVVSQVANVTIAKEGTSGMI